MEGVVYARAFDAPPVSMDEALRYAGARGSADAEVSALARECLALAEGALEYKVCWCEVSLRREPEGVDLGFTRTGSKALGRCLAGCDSAVVFAATVGMGLDRLIHRAQTTSPARALMLQALGAERIEALCDAFCRDLAARAAERGRAARPRFSPGYGDWPLEAQRDIFRLLDCPRRIGLTLNNSLLMSPSKSVTAVVGLGAEQGCAPSGCAACGQRQCPYRRG